MTEKWIDVSAHNGKIDWAKVKASGIYGAVIRGGYGCELSQQDACFTANIKGAIAAGLKVGVYWFHYADSVERMLQEWAVCRQIIESYRKNILFVASDYEYDSVRYYQKLHGSKPENALINRMVNAFLGAAKADGWGTMLYTNNDYRRNIFSALTLTTWDVWLADYTGGPDIPCAMQQTGSTGTVPGIAARVDMDVCYRGIGEDAAPAPSVEPTPAAAPPKSNGGVTIRTAQQFYNARGAGIAVDGIWGPATQRAAIMSVQRGCNQAYKSGLTVDGIWGPKTAAAVRTLRRGNNNAAVWSLQAALMARGYGVGSSGIDGKYGSGTEAAVRTFQRAAGLTVDGLAGKKTFEKLCG